MSLPNPSNFALQNPEAFDPLLSLFIQSDRYISLRGKLYPGSIRDQQIRAEMLMDKTGRKNWWGEGKTIVVIGSGVAGVSAALCAAGAQDYLKSSFGKAKVVLLDKEPAPFARQRRSQREIEPVGYDWPRSHWAQQEPAGGILQFPPSKSEDLVLRWTAQFQDFLQNNSNLHYHPESKLSDSWLLKNTDETAANPWTVLWKDKNGNDVATPADMVLNCTGFGKEADRFPGEGAQIVNNFRSYPFWQADRVGEPNFGLAKLDGKILIAGGGDGALQDLFRILTGKTSIGLLRSIGSSIPHTLLVELGDAEESAARLLHYQQERQPSPATKEMVERILSRLSLKFQKMAQTQLDSNPLLIKALHSELRTEARLHLDSAPSAPLVELHFGQSHLGRCYAANHFLAYLFLQAFPALVRQEANSRILAAQVIGAPEQELSPAQCLWGRKLRIQRQTSQGSQEILDGYSMVINRIGSSEPGDSSSVVVQLLPYACPWWPELAD